MVSGRKKFAVKRSKTGNEAGLPRIQKSIKPSESSEFHEERKLVQSCDQAVLPFKFKPLDILFEDDDLVIVNKQPGMLVIPDRYNSTLANLKAILAARYGEIFVVHRLDKGTSGIVMFAKNADAHAIMNQRFEDRSVQKIYHAVVGGRVEQDTLDIDIPLMPSTKKKGLMQPSARGKESLTKVTVLERFRIASLIECELITGRQHQIRVHCSAIGHPLLVDEDYGENATFKVSMVKRKYNVGKHQEEKPLIERLTLHAHKLKFLHPRTAQEIDIIADYPKDFRALLQILEKYAPFKTLSWDTIVPLHSR